MCNQSSPTLTVLLQQLRWYWPCIFVLITVSPAINSLTLSARCVRDYASSYTNYQVMVVLIVKCLPRPVPPNHQSAPTISVSPVINSHTSLARCVWLCLFLYYFPSHVSVDGFIITCQPRPVPPNLYHLWDLTGGSRFTLPLSTCGCTNSPVQHYNAIQKSFNIFLPFSTCFDLNESKESI